MSKTKYFVLAVVGCILSVLLCIGMIIYMAIAKDLARVVTDQRFYIKELEWENEQVEMICTTEEEK